MTMHINYRAWSFERGLTEDSGFLKHDLLFISNESTWLEMVIHMGAGLLI